MPYLNYEGMIKKVVIVDYQLSNLFSVQQACEKVGITTEITSDYRTLMAADGAILPGVGAFGDAISNLIDLDLVLPIRDFIASGRPFMGICLGMQLLFSESLEFGEYKGLNVIPGIIRKFPDPHENHGLKVPQICWNTIRPPGNHTWEGTPLQGVKKDEYMYFVHSFYADPDNPSDVLTETTYGDCTYCSAVHRDNVFATQFHPEKSGETGVQIYSEWASMLTMQELEG